MYKIPANTVFMGKKIISLPSCESTNTLMISLSQADKLEEGSVITTEHQTMGRGQAGNVWIAEPGMNLTFSVLLKPAFLEPGRQFFLNMAVGLAVRDGVEAFVNASIKVKWPNDIMAEDRKICGILIENQLLGQQFSQSVVGIGLNINQKSFSWPKATSMSLESGQLFNRAEVLEKILVNLELRYEQLRARRFELLTSDYYASLYWKGEQHQFEAAGKIITGSIEGVDDIGRLLLRTADGVVKYNFKEIAFVG